jgi:hypothetical protein
VSVTRPAHTTSERYEINIQQERIMKTRVFLVALAIGLFAFTTSLRADDKVEAKGDKVEFDVHNGHFVKNTFKPAGDAAFLAFADQKGFEEVFGIGRVIGKQNFVPKDAFDKKIVVAAIRSGNSLTTYKVDKVTADGDTLYVQYGAEKGSAGTATYSSPLIITVDKGKIKNVVFIENGKKAGTADLGKGSGS